MKRYGILIALTVAMGCGSSQPSHQQQQINEQRAFDRCTAGHMGNTDADVAAYNECVARYPG